MSKSDYSVLIYVTEVKSGGSTPEIKIIAACEVGVEKALEMFSFVEILASKTGYSLAEKVLQEVL